MTLIERQLESVGNLDPTQLNIAIQDSFVQLGVTPPLSVFFGISIPQITMLFRTTGDNLSIGIPYSGQNLTGRLNSALPPTVQAYLDNFPFGNITRPDSQLLVTTLVLSAQSNFVYTIAALYALLSASLVYLFTRPVAEPLTIQSVLSGTREIAVPAEIDRINPADGTIDNLSKEALINHSIGYYHSMIRHDTTARHTVLKIDPYAPKVTSRISQRIYEHLRTRRSRITWVITPALGAPLVYFGIAAWRHPYAISHNPQNMGASVLSALFTWALGLWRTLSLLAVGGLIRQAVSDVSAPDVNF